MKDENQNTDKSVPQETPVSREDLDQLEHLQRVRVQLSQEGVDIDLRKVEILATVRRLDQQRDEIFRKILEDRGFPQGTVIEINPKDGSFKVSS
jgi:septal ring factor EnvC (AmiA/AmiB activator)